MRPRDGLPLKKILWVLPAFFTAPAAVVRAEIQGPPIATNGYKVDVGQSVITGSPREVAMGGAFTAIAEGVSAIQDNFAAAAFRPRRSTGPWDWDATLGLRSASGNDYDNNGNFSSPYKKNLLVDVGGVLYSGTSGGGVYATGQQFDVEDASGTHRFEFVTTYLAVGHQFFDRQLTGGVGLRVVAFNAYAGTSNSAQLLTLNAVGANLGVLWQPNRGALRLGAAVAGHVHEYQPLYSTTTKRVNGLIVPEEVTEPTTFSVGAAYEWRLRGRPLLLSSEARLITGVKGAYGTESFLEQKAQKSGERARVSYHAGAESEILSDVLRLRAGGYLEPSRFEGVDARLHATGGFELRLFRLPILGGRPLSLALAVDAARRYTATYLALGLWQSAAPPAAR